MPKAKSSPASFKNLFKRFPIAISVGVLAFAFSIFSIYEINQVLAATDKTLVCKNGVLLTSTDFPPSCTNPGGPDHPLPASMQPRLETLSKKLNGSQRLQLAGWIIGTVAGGLLVFGDWVYISKKIKHSKGRLKPRRK